MKSMRFILLIAAAAFVVSLCVVWYFGAVDASFLKPQLNSPSAGERRHEALASRAIIAERPVQSASAGLDRRQLATNEKLMPAEARFMSFGGHRDIWGFATGALNSRNTGYLFEAYAAATECIGFQKLMPDLLALTSGSSDNVFKRQVSADQQLAIQALVERCYGFARAGLSAQAQLLQDLGERAMALQSPEFFAAFRRSNRQLSLAEQKVLLFSDSAAARDMALNGLVTTWSAVNAIADPSDPRIAMAGVAAMLVMCDLGRDCSENSYHTLLRCALSAPCGSQSLWADWANGFSDAEAHQILLYRTTMVKAIQARRLELLADK